MEGRLASRQWAKSYIETNAVIAAIAEHMKRFLEEAGYVVFTTPATHNFDREKLMSDWSHRHAAYVAGLGKFGVNNMLITASGCCGRLGSFLTSLAVDPDERDATEACLHRRGIPCLRCVSRCVNNALFEDGFDRKRCYTMCLENGRNFREIGKADVCGKCLVGLPCSLSIPVSGRKAVE
jgi:epoxyqueuosine reductase QueG